MFQTRTSWWVSGLSLFAVNASLSVPFIYSGLFYSEGIGGLWLLWSAVLVSGFLPFVFAPMWARLNFITDNQFILFRFSGKGAFILHLFRAIYVGLFIVAFMMSFQLLAFLKVITFYTSMDRATSFALLAVILLALSFKNRLGLNMRLDSVHTLLFISVFVFGALALFDMEPGIVAQENAALPTNLFPENAGYFLVLILVQTWSVNLFDGSGIQAQRFFSTRNKSHVWKVAVLASLLGVCFSLTLLAILHLGVHKLGVSELADSELHIVHYLEQGIHPWLRPMLPIAFFAIFISTYEGLLNWGASFLSVDGYQTYLNKEADPRRMERIALLSMLLITVFSLGLCWFNDSLAGLIKVLFSITAGVAPVFVLRWFWMRINAWTQLSAMLGSGVYTLIYSSGIAGSGWETQIIDLSGLNTYSIQLIFITVFTTITWLAVMFATPPDEAAHLQRFQASVSSMPKLRSNVVKALLFGLLMTAILLGGVYAML